MSQWRRAFLVGLILTAGISRTQTFADDNICTPSGDVGIGTTSPARKLDVRGGGGGGYEPLVNIAIPNNAIGGSLGPRTFSANPRQGLKIFSTQSLTLNSEYYDIDFQTGTVADDSGDANTVMKIRNNGNVGIGTSSPGARLDVNGIFRYGSSPSQYAYGYSDSAGAYLEGYSNNGSTNRIRIQSSNRNGMANHNGIMIGELAINGKKDGIQFYTGGAFNNRMVIDSSGNVGIGTVSTNEKLHVAGNIFVSGGKVRGPSDVRLKKNIVPMTGVLSKLNKIRGVTFEWKDPSNLGTEYGVIAQEVESQFPELVATHKDGFKSVNYQGFVAPLIAGIQELSKENMALKKKVESLELRLQDLSDQKQKLADLEKLVKGNLISNGVRSQALTAAKQQ